MQKFTFRQYSLEKRDNVCKARDNVYGMKIYFVDENTDNNFVFLLKTLKDIFIFFACYDKTKYGLY